MNNRYRTYEFGEIDSRGDEQSGSALRIALLFGALAIGTAVLAVPFLQGAAAYYAESGAPGTDRITTGSVGGADRYTIRRSVLTVQPEKICGTKNIRSCGTN